MKRRWPLVSAALLGVAMPAAAEPLRIVVAVGHTVGLAGETKLRHPQGDATRVAKLFVELGSVKKENAIIVLDPSVDQLNAALARAQALARTRRPEEVSFVFYYSGHGDRTALHLGGVSVPIDDLKKRVYDVPAALRMLVTDSCRTTDGRAKGMSFEAPFAVKLDEGVGARGMVWFHASADGEAAQESDQLGSGIFTHYWTSGLRGAADRNGDGNVSLAESYEYAYSQTLLRSARSAGVLQRPEVVYDVRELVPVVLTRPAASSRIALPREAETHYLVYGLGSRSVVAEADGDAGRSVELAVAPGRYLVHRRAGGHGGAIEFALARHETRQLAAADFHAVSEEQLAKKGGTLILRPNEIDAAFAVGHGSLAPFGQALRLGYFHNEGGLGFGARTSAFFGTDTRDAYQLSRHGFDLRALIEYRLTVGMFTVRGGLGPMAMLLWQNGTRNDADRIGLVGYATETSERALAFGGNAFLAARTMLFGPTYAELGFGFDVLGVRSNQPARGATPATSTTRALVAGDLSFALGFRF